MAAPIAALVLLLALLASIWPWHGKPSTVTKLERTCAYEGNFIPCFIVDEALQSQWRV